MLGYKHCGMIVLTGLMVVALCGCAERQSVAGAPTAAEITRSEAPKVVPPAPETAAASLTPLPAVPVPPLPAAKIAIVPKANSADCYHLRPASGRKGGRCEPQSLPYARCRSGIMSCRIGKENGPLTWFACEQKRNNTGSAPEAGSILVLAANKGRGMPTGHIMYVEAVLPLTPSTCQLVLSHTNYDRKCSLETNIEAVYDHMVMSLDIKSGAWKAWGQGLGVAGFIYN